MKSRNLILIVMLLAFVVVSTGCMAGPWTFREYVDDWAAGVYSDNSYLGTVVYLIVWPIGEMLGSVVDAVVFNNVAWWGQDVWNGKGTTYNHKSAPNGANNATGNHIMEQPQL
jgi:hypothetical protein